MSNEQTLREAVNRFLGWKLPKDFLPDAGISFDAEYSNKFGMPTGTNLFTADQAKAMFEYCLENNEHPKDKEIERLKDLVRAYEHFLKEAHDEVNALSKKKTLRQRIKGIFVKDKP